jgi:hypothetical protein
VKWEQLVVQRWVVLLVTGSLVVVLEVLQSALSVVAWLAMLLHANHLITHR